MLRRFQQHLRATQGRPLASVLALALAAWLALPGDGPLPWLRLNLFDLYQTALPRPRLSGPVAVIGIDEAALKRYGQWPWPRTQLAHLIDAVNAHHPLAIGLDIIMPETDSSSPEALAARLRGTDAKLAESLAALPPNDDVLAASIRRAPVVLGVAGFDVPAASTTDVVRAWPVRSLGGEARQFVRHYPQALASLPQMQANARGQAILSADLETGLVRRVPLVASVGESLLPSLSLELLRVATGERAVGVHVGEGGIDSVSVGDLTVPTQPGGRVWPHFSKSWPERYVSAAEVLDGRVAPDRLENRIAIVALTGIGLNDYKTTARGQVVPGVDVHAELIESFFDGRFVQRPPSIRWAEVGLFALLAALTIWLLPRFSLRAAAAAGLVLSAGLFGGGAALFWYAGLLFDAASVWVALGFVGVTLLASLLSAAKRDRRESERALQRARESAARTAGELSAARRIQMATLPDSATAFPGETRFSLAALLEPARDVGGDLYDFFMLDRDRLFFVIGDVSGKGLPASLFMVVAKALSKSIALRGGEDIARIVAQANEELARENPEMLFVTGVYGILDAASGEVALCNAGHDAPRRIATDGSVATLPEADGPPLCVLDGFEYPVQRYRLSAGESLCLLTDGVTEAMDEQGALYGHDRLDALLAQQGGAAPANIVWAIREDVRKFVGTAEASDDLTLLVLRYNGP